MRGIERTFGVNRNTLSAWLKKSSATLSTRKNTGAGER